MKTLLFAAGLIVLLSVHSSRSEDKIEKLRTALERGILNELQQLANNGVKLSKKDVEEKFTQIVAIEAVKNTKLFKEVKERDAMKIINDSIRSREVFEAATALMSDDEEIAPRFVGAAIIGGGQLASDWVKMMLTRY
ncbi:uncharacterized protein LOC129001806 [Macrosteles quadrilineatus]|uniref:uncharacterized protein LOC129001806 n=1 Tax=Macrosteles quadrilineatus TaxID=74068 RepID=UPI0023E0F6D7|nr:uncharacterized protein LOC129001806 [Macrosteles quadrilineatus]